MKKHIDPVIQQMTEANLPDLLLLLRMYGAYMYEELALKAGKGTFHDELTSFPVAAYSGSSGCFLIAYYDNTPCGCIGLKRWDDRTCEMKRMFVRPAYRRMGVGTLLTNAVISKAAELGYQEILLDTNEEMDAALLLYSKAGFERIAAYCENENPHPVYLKKKLSVTG